MTDYAPTRSHKKRHKANRRSAKRARIDSTKWPTPTRFALMNGGGLK